MNSYLAASSPEIQEREFSVFISLSAQNTDERLTQYINELFSLLHHLLREPESAEVRVTAVYALSLLAQYTDAGNWTRFARSSSPCR